MAKQFGVVYCNYNQNKKLVDYAALEQEVEINYSVPACRRGIDMLLAKFRGEPFQTEVVMQSHNEIPVPVLKKPMTQAKIALVTDGGLVPKGNPDSLLPANSDKFCCYSLCGADTLFPEEYEVSHQGYNNTFILDDPNRLLPVDCIRKAVKDGVVGSLLECFYTTAGVMTSVENSKLFGEKIAALLTEKDVDGVILTSTCGTSTRCGSVVTKEIERLGIPVVQVTNLTKIAEGIGVNRILRGNNICYVFGDPALPHDGEVAYRMEMVMKALKLLESVPPENESLIRI